MLTASCGWSSVRACGGVWRAVAGGGRRGVGAGGRRAGAAAAGVMEQPMAAAVGAGRQIPGPLGKVVVGVGGGTSGTAVISLGGVVALQAVRVGSFDIDASIQSYVRR